MLVTTPVVGKLLLRNRRWAHRRVTAGAFGPIVKRGGRALLVDLKNVEARTGRTFTSAQIADAIGSYPQQED